MINVKRGDTLAFIVRRKNADGTPRTGEASQLKAQMRSGKDVLIGEFAITETPTPGDYLCQIAATLTQDYIPGTYNCDIQYTEGVVVQSSQTFQIVIEKDVTRNE